MATIPYKKSSRRQMQKEETRRIILASAYALFGAKGYEKTTMRELAAHADVGLGTIFKHFPDKPSLLFSTFLEDIEAILQNTMNTLPPDNIRMQLTHIAAELYEFLGNDSSFSSALLSESFFLKGSNKERLSHMSRSFHERIETLLLEAVQKNELDKRIDTRNAYLTFLAYFFLGLVNGLHEHTFNVKKQTMLFAAMLDNHIAPHITTGKT